MIDFHTHILFDIDDGPSNLEGSLKMAQVAVEHGTTTIVATPHAPGLGDRYHADLVHERVNTLRMAIKEADIPLEIIPGGELYYNANLVERLHEGVFLTCGGTRTILIECPIYEKLPDDFSQIVVDLQVAGYRVVLAHPERIIDVRKNANTLTRYIERGVLMQLTSQALTGEQGQETRELAELLLKHNMIHLIASDAHSASYRPPILSKARQEVVRLLGEAAANRLFHDTPRALIGDALIELPKPEPVPERKRWFW